MPTPSVKVVILRITLIIAVVELTIMLLLGSVEHDLDSPLEALLDASLLVVLATPAIYTWVIKPYVKARDDALAQVTHMAFHDPLTQLANRRLLSEHFKKMTAHFDRDMTYGALLLIDLDGFKAINDSHGHGLGDAILIEIAIRLQSMIREEDVVSRLGGDEFVILVNQLHVETRAAQHMAVAIAERIRQVLRQPFEFKGLTFQLDASIGIRLLNSDKPDIKTVLREADAAMYIAKQAGGGRVEVFA